MPGDNNFTTKVKQPFQEDLLGYVLGALDADQQEAVQKLIDENPQLEDCLLYTSPSPRDATLSRMPSSA